MRSLKTVLSIAVLMTVIFMLYHRFKPAPNADVVTVSDTATAVTNDAATGAAASADENVQQVETPQSTDSPDLATTGGATPTDVAQTLNTPAESVDPDARGSQTPTQNFPELYGYEIGHEGLSEADMVALIKRLRNDQALVSDVLNELRAETDPTRLKRLTALLGDSGVAEVLPVAEELVYSANPDSRDAGLDLLSRLAPKNPQAYDIANSILGSATEPDVLVSAMNILALPKNATSESRATSITQVMPLANHDSAAVRRHSVSILVRLTNDQTLSPVLSNALNDPDASVREAAVYAYVSYPYQTAETVQKLVDLVADPNEERGIRNGAILVLNNNSPDDATQAVISTAKKQMRDALRAR